MDTRDLLFSGDVEGLNKILNLHPALANAGISLRNSPAAAHPLHRICDGVSEKYYTEEIGMELAKVFLSHGANLNPDLADGKDSPLTAACSMRCDQLALLYIERGARIDHKGCHGGTALHWAAWCGRDVVADVLAPRCPDINQLCIDFKSTPLFWAVHGHRFGGAENRHHQVNCVSILLKHGADPSIPNFEGYLAKQLIEDGDNEMLALFL